MNEFFTKVYHIGISVGALQTNFRGDFLLRHGLGLFGPRKENGEIPGVQFLYRRLISGGRALQNFSLSSSDVFSTTDSHTQARICSLSLSTLFCFAPPLGAKLLRGGKTTLGENNLDTTSCEAGGAH